MKAVIFDLDGTLINSTIPFKKMKSKIIQHLERKGVTPGLLNDGMLNFEITGKAEEDYRRRGISEEEIRGTLRQVSQIMNRFELESLDNATLVEDVPETLTHLKAKGFKLGIMTRSCREYAQRILDKFGLGEFFDAVVARDDVEAPKPNPKHAFHLLGLLAVPAEEALYVGDHWSDGECARKAGLRFVLLRRNGQISQIAKDFSFKTVDHIRDIYKLVEASI